VRNVQLTVGLFVSLALVVFIALTLWLSGRQGSEARTSYSMYFYKDVSGLSLGGPVYYLGVEVGNVTRMDIVPGNPMSIRIDVNVLESTPVDTGTSASLAYQGITGVAVINLVGAPGMNLPLKAPPGFEYPVIEVRDMGLAALLSGAPMIMNKLNALLDEAGRLIGEENQELVNGTLKNINSLSEILQTEEGAFANLPGDLSETLKEAQSALSELRSMTDDIKPGINATMRNMEEISERMNSLTGRLDQWTAENSADMDDFLNNGLGQVPDLVSDARDALREMEKLMKEIRENPSSLVYKPADDSIRVEQ